MGVRLIILDVGSPTIDLWKEKGKTVRVRMPGYLKNILGLGPVQVHNTVIHMATMYGPYGTRIELTKEAFDQCLVIVGGSFRIPWTPRPPQGITYPLSTEGS